MMRAFFRHGDVTGLTVYLVGMGCVAWMLICAGAGA